MLSNEAIHQQVETLLSQMTLEEKAGMCSGADFWHLKGVERLGIPSVMVTDGPHGLRKQAQGADHLGINESEKAICFPAGCATASSFDRELIRKQGELLGQECQAMDVSTHIKSDKVKILTGEQELVSVDNGARIDYTKSDEKLVLGDREVAMPDDAAYHQLVVPNAKHASLVLSDGSVLYVNAGTRVVYPDKFKKDYREIFVDGEVYIDVVKNEKAPFKVHTTSCDIEVLGTSFNVQAYSSDTNAEVVLLRGSVKLKDKHEEELLLQPDELAVIMGSSIKEKKHVNASDYILWTKGLLKLDATPLSAVFKRLERYYGVKLAYPEEMESMKLYGSLDLQCSLEEVLRRISLTAPISFQKMDNELEIHINNVHKNN